MVIYKYAYYCYCYYYYYYYILPQRDYVTFGLCYRKSVCRLSFVICLSSVRFLRPTQGLKLSATNQPTTNYINVRSKADK